MTIDSDSDAASENPELDLNDSERAIYHEEKTAVIIANLVTAYLFSHPNYVRDDSRDEHIEAAIVYLVDVWNRYVQRGHSVFQDYTMAMTLVNYLQRRGLIG